MNLSNSKNVLRFKRIYVIVMTFKVFVWVAVVVYAAETDTNGANKT